MAASDDAAAKYGAIGAMVRDNPELKGIFDRAVAEEWAPDRFVMEVQNTEWWKTHSDTARARIALETNDPASAQQQFAQQVDVVKRMAAQAGYTYDIAIINDIAMSSLYSGASKEQLQSAIVDRMTPTGLAGGDYATTQNQLRSIAASYGGDYGDDVTAAWTKNILNGSMTVEQWTEQMKSNAISTFPALADQIKNTGMTLMQIATPYINTYAQLMEVPPESVDFKTNLLIRKALQGTGNSADANGTTPVVTPLWKLEQQVKQEPGWGLTKNAHAEVDSITNRLGKDFGFLS